MRQMRWMIAGMLFLSAASCRHPQATSTPVVSPAPATQPLAHLVIHVTDLRSKNGQLIFGIFKSADGFPSVSANSVNWQVKPATGDGIFTVDLPPGDYGASVLHDENSNGKMDTNLLGIPREGYGVTNNPKPHRRAATYNESVFTLPPRGIDLTLSIQYDFL